MKTGSHVEEVRSLNLLKWPLHEFDIQKTGRRDIFL